ncbi:hypothetical protein C0995_014490 [Termitomyces sp. Mi166|nr:hypothetical protein C0995_014490 [Termitomyces sp. Mi166\
MTESGLSPTSMSSDSVSSDALAAAVERRTRQLPTQPSAAQMAAEHERRQAFRRLIDPGIVRPNSKEQAVASLKTLLTIAENLLHEPDNPKFQQFKPTNTIIKKNLVEPKGTLEYAIEVSGLVIYELVIKTFFAEHATIQLGFRPEVKNFQPYYIFSPRHTNDLRTGTAILREFVDLENQRAERAAHSKVDQKAVAATVAQQVKLAYMEDRKTKQQKDEREKELRAVRAVALTHQAESREMFPSQLPPPQVHMPGSGHTLNSEAGPPPYEDSL